MTIRLPAIIVSLAAVVLIAGTAVAVEDVDCTDRIEQIPRDGSTIDVANPWLTYSGNMVYSGVADATSEDVRIDGGEVVELDEVEALSYRGLRPGELTAGPFEWQVGAGPVSTFRISPSATIDDEPPTMGDGEVEASLELMVYEEFPVIYRHWTVSFPSARDERTAPENLRYLLTFQWQDGDEDESATILVTPTIEMADRERIEVELGGRIDHCHHAEPNLALTAEAALTVRAIDLAGNLSENFAEGVFEGVSAEKLATAHEEFNEVIASLDTDDDGPTTEEVVRQMDEEAEEAGGRCSTVGTGPLSLLTILSLIALVGLGARTASPHQTKKSLF